MREERKVFWTGSLESIEVVEAVEMVDGFEVGVLSTVLSSFLYRSLANARKLV